MWDTVLHLSHEMLEHARQGEWNEVIGKESERQKLMQEFFSTTPTIEEAEWLAHGIRQVLELDRQVMQSGQQEKAKLGDAIRAVQKGGKVSQAYRNIA